MRQGGRTGAWCWIVAAFVALGGCVGEPEAPAGVDDASANEGANGSPPAGDENGSDGSEAAQDPEDPSGEDASQEDAGEPSEDASVEPRKVLFEEAYAGGSPTVEGTFDAPASHGRFTFNVESEAGTTTGYTLTLTSPSSEATTETHGENVNAPGARCTTFPMNEGEPGTWTFTLERLATENVRILVVGYAPSEGLRGQGTSEGPCEG